MSLEPELLALMTQPFAWERFVGQDLYGNNDYSTPLVNIPARLDVGYKRRQSSIPAAQAQEAGDSDQSETQYTIFTPVQVWTYGIHDRLTLFDGTQVFITRVRIEWDETGTNPHHLVIDAETGAES